KRNIGYALRGKVNDEAIVFPLCHVVEILHANYLGDGLSLSQLLGSNVAQTDLTDQPLTLEFCQHGQRLRNRSLRRFRESANPKIDDVQCVKAEISQVVMNGINQLLARESMRPGFIWSATSAHFGDDHETIRIRMERLLNDLIGHMRTVVVAGIDVVHTGLY